MMGGKDERVSPKSLYSGRNSNPDGLSDDTHFLPKSRAVTLSSRVAFKLRLGVTCNMFGKKKEREIVAPLE